MKCLLCGGDCLTVSKDSYKCPYCGSVYSKDDFEKETSFKKQVVQTSKKDIGVNVFDKVVNGVIEIRCKGKTSTWCGSGYVVTANGYAITNAHVAANEDGSPCENMYVNICNQTIQAHVVALADDRAGKGSGVDLALIKLDYLPRNAVTLSLANFSNVHTGERVYVLGNSLGDGTCMTSGIVSDKNRVLNGKTLLMTDCAINGGNSGGPIFNVDGEVIGTICSSRVKSDGSDVKGMNYAIPITFTEELLRKCGI